MEKQAFNPYLPGYEYIPDGEPYVFDDRIYVYGSHDRFNGKIFCLNDYVCWSAPVDDLSDWRYEGVIYKKKQDPKNRWGLRLLFAPDVVQGPDGRFYLYYAFDFMGIMGVAVCDTPAGQYQFLGHIHYKDGTLWGRRKGDSFPFDPGVLMDDDGKIYLYSGFYMPVPSLFTGLKSLKFEGCYVLELEKDMVSVKTGEKLMLPKEGENAFAGHEFFEASSIRKYKGKYYFVYSSRHNHELCYAVSDRPDGGYVFGGTLVSNGDLFLEGNDDEKLAGNYIGNNHGGMVEVNGQYYIFYHRHTNRTSYSRQACAEPIRMSENGSFEQVEMTSCGLNGGPLKDEGSYEARIACNLWSKEGTGRYDVSRSRKVYAKHPYFTQDGRDRSTDSIQYIANMRDGSTAGYKFFLFERAKRLTVSVRGKANGILVVSTDKESKEVAACLQIESTSRHWKDFTSEFTAKPGVFPLYFRFRGHGSLDFLSFSFD